MYVHEVLINENFLGMNHFRIAPGKEDAVQRVVLGRTMAVKPLGALAAKNKAYQFPEGFYIPDHSLIVPNVRFREEIVCEDLDDFKNQGIARWERLVRSAGNVAKVTSELEREDILRPRMSVDGRPLPGQYDAEFKKFVPSVEEIAALESIAIRANNMVRPQTSAHGNYL